MENCHVFTCVIIEASTEQEITIIDLFLFSLKGHISLDTEKKNALDNLVYNLELCLPVV